MALLQPSPYFFQLPSFPTLSLSVTSSCLTSTLHFHSGNSQPAAGFSTEQIVALTCLFLWSLPAAPLTSLLVLLQHWNKGREDREGHCHWSSQKNYENKCILFLHLRSLEADLHSEAHTNFLRKTLEIGESTREKVFSVCCIQYREEKKKSTQLVLLSKQTES